MKRQSSGLNETEVSDYLKRNQTAPIVDRRAVKEVAGRIDRTGAEIAALDEPGARAVAAELIADGVQAIAICTLWSTQNPAHERRLRELVLEAAPQIAISLSHEVSPSVGEYARMSTTAANTALKPVTSRYATRLQAALGDLGLTVPVLMMTGTGGVVPAEYLAELPVAALLSGPAAGVIACQQLGRAMGRDRILTTDIGGTSFDVGLIVDGNPLLASQFSFGGVDLRVPCIDVRSIGAGGGSIASVRFGELTVGPDSAGANPGPACYGRGGTLPTGTDADLVLGTLSVDGFVAGGLRLERAAAERAITEHVAAPLGIELIEAAWGIRQVLDNRMADLLRQVTIERGHDPRTFTMFAHGGSGPSHGWVLSREIGIDEFVIPATATVQPALGSGLSDLKVTSERPIHVRLSANGRPDPEQLEALRRAFDAVVEEAVQADLGETADGRRPCRPRSRRATEGSRTTSTFRSRARTSRRTGSGFASTGMSTSTSCCSAAARASPGRLRGPRRPRPGDAGAPLHCRAAAGSSRASYRHAPGVVRRSCPAHSGQRVCRGAPGGRPADPWSGADRVPGADRRDRTRQRCRLRRSRKSSRDVRMSQVPGLDPITYEVIRNRMIAITEEMPVALQNVSGSPAVAEASDFFTGLFLADGTGVSMGFRVSFGGSAVASLIRHMIAQSTAVAEGDISSPTIPTSVLCTRTTCRCARRCFTPASWLPGPA